MLDILQHKSVKTMKENVNEVQLLPVLGINVFFAEKKKLGSKYEMEFNNELRLL